jgi:hypothetical protein
MKHESKRRRWTLGALTLVGVTYASIALAADQRLDDADAAVVKAIALLEAAENPGVVPAFGGHRLKALIHLKKGRAEIGKAKAWADNPKHKPKPPAP